MIFTHVGAAECAAILGDGARSDADARRLRALVRLLRAYIPNVDAPGLLGGGTYDGVAMCAPRLDDPDRYEVVGGSVYRGRRSPAGALDGGRRSQFVGLALFAVENACQGRKLGKKLMGFVKGDAKARHGAEALLSYADFKAFAFFRRVGFSRSVTLPHAAWRPCIVHYEGAAVVEALLSEEAEKAAADFKPRERRLVGCTSGRANCYCKSGRTRAIARYDVKTGAELEVYCSSADAGRKLGLATCAVTHVTNGIAQCAQGHYFRYVNEVGWLNSGSRAVMCPSPRSPQRRLAKIR